MWKTTFFAVYLVNEIPKEYLPDFYVKQVHNIVDQCFHYLPLDEYRSNIENLPERSKFIQNYSNILKEMFRMTNYENELFIDMNSELLF